MAENRSIEIDFDVHKRIETERRSFSETPNDVLRRLLGFPPKVRTSGKDQVVLANSGSWTGKRVRLPAGTQLRMEYNGQQHVGEILDGLWSVEGERYNSPSAAAGGVARTRAGTKPSLDGWIYWEVKRPGDDDWIPIKALRLGRR